MSDLMQYKGYYGSYHLDTNDNCFYGKLEFIKALVTYEAESAKELYDTFVDAVDDYLIMCQQEGIGPEKPLKGSFNVRVGEELHRRAAVTAANQGISLNQFVCKTLQNAAM